MMEGEGREGRQGGREGRRGEDDGRGGEGGERGRGEREGGERGEEGSHHHFPSKKDSIHWLTLTTFTVNLCMSGCMFSSNNLR